MKKIFWIVIVVFIVGSCYNNSNHERNDQPDAETYEAERIEQSIKSDVGQMVMRTRAIDNWAQHLCNGETFRFAPILTIELEQLWMKNDPILFNGVITDIYTHNQTHYSILIKRTILLSAVMLLRTELNLSLISPKENIDTLLQNHPDIIKDNLGFSKGVAVIAFIDSIKPITSQDGEINKIKVGYGKLVDIMYTGIVKF